MMPSNLKHKFLFIGAIIVFLFTLCLPSFSVANSYSYDNGNRLLYVVDDATGNLVEYQYDESGNRTQKITHDPSTITATAGPNGSISPSGAVTLPSGSSQTYSITPVPGYVIAAHTISVSFVASIDPCIGGVVTTDGTHTIRTFISRGTFYCRSDITAEVLVVAGGGGGANRCGGGAGEAGHESVNYTGGIGGIGVQYPQFAGGGGSPAGWFAGGGGGYGNKYGGTADTYGGGGYGKGALEIGSTAANGVANTGGGGGGGVRYTDTLGGSADQVS